MAKCMCKNCMNEGTHKIRIAKRGNRFGYLCDYHFNHEESYSTENNYRAGERKQNAFTYSMELETSASTAKARGELLDFGFIASYDCTVDIEYKSPIYEGLNALSKQCISIESLIENGNLEINHTCGTHFHVGNADSINPETMGYIRRFYHSLLVPLSNKMRENPEKTEKFWGRDFLSSDWAQPINEYTEPMNHRNFINLEHPYTIEFRLAKFQNAKQYMNMVKFCKDAVNAVIENFIKHFNNTNIDSRRYKNMTEYRKHKAQVTANKIVKLYEKYSANI